MLFIETKIVAFKGEWLVVISKKALGIKPIEQMCKIKYSGNLTSPYCGTGLEIKKKAFVGTCGIILIK